MSDWQQPDSYIRGKALVVLDLPRFATKKELEHATVVDTSGLAARLINYIFKNWLMFQLVWMI